ncbi:MAG: TlpA family protein disulfide reductase [Alphaproteobacteria bacterium]|nr:TlpA family protein disulfide reductase [Alphaproteobacteria bacterium]
MALGWNPRVLAGRLLGAALLDGATTGCLTIATATRAADAGLLPWDGEAGPAFALDDLAGQRRHLDEFHGKVVLVHFFATWCARCVDEMTSLQKLTVKTRGRTLVVVAIDVAEVELRVRAFFEALPVDFPVLLDRDRAVTKAWDVVSLPTTFVLEAELRSRLVTATDLDWPAPATVARLEALYPPPPPQDRTGKTRGSHGED